MQVMKWSVIALAVAAGTTQMAVASSQSESKGRSEVALYFWSTLAPADFESGKLIKNDQVIRSFRYFWPPRAPRSGHLPHHRRTSPAFVSKCRRAIHRFDRANSVTSCAVFFARPRKRVFT